jgi:hypothetical protein
MSLWDIAAAKMDAAVDGIVGDTISYALDGLNFADVQGFVLDDTTGEDGYEALREDNAVRKRVKIAKAKVPEISLDHRLRHPRLGTATFRPTNSIPQSEGRYWLFDVQKV